MRKVPVPSGHGVVAAAMLSCMAAATAAAGQGERDEPSIELRWSGPSECPSDTFVAALDRMLVGSAVVAPIRVDAVVVSTGDGWSILTDFDAGPGRTGQRSFEAPSCRTVTQAAALAIAIAVDPSVLDRLVVEPAPTTEPAVVQVPDEPTEPPAPLPPIGPIVAAEPSAADPVGSEPPSGWRALLGVSGFIDGGALPGPGGGIAGTVGVLHRKFRGEVVGGYRFATRKAASLEPSVGGEFTQWSVGALGCGVPRLGPIELPLCAGLEGGRTVGQGTGVRVPFTSAQPWVAGLAAVGLAWPLRPWLALTVRASLALPLLRQDFSITGAGLVHRVGPAQGRGLVGLELRLPW